MAHSSPDRDEHPAPSMRRRLLAFARATHLPPTLLVTALACGFAVSVGRGGPGVVAVGAAVLAGQASVGWANDWLDAGRDLAVGRRDKPTVTGELRPRHLRHAALLALGASAVLSLLSGPAATAAHLAALGLAWGYDLGLKRTRLSLVPYVGAFALLPAFVTLGLTGAPWPPWWLVAAAGLLGGGAHFINALPDLTDDARTGVRGLPQRLGARASLTLGAALLGLGAAVVVTNAATGTAVVIGAALLAVLVAAIVLAGVSRRLRLAWTLTLALAGLAMLLLLIGGTTVT